METINRNKKLIWAGVVLAVLILAVIGWQYWQYIHSMSYQQTQGIKNLEKMAEESDKYGGKTPEETVALFAYAVKKGDFDLASKYGNPSLIKPALEKMKSDGQIDTLVNGLENGKLEENPGFGGNSFDLRITENSKNYWVLSLYKSNGGIWKIVEF